MVVIRNWRDQDPYVGHQSALIWALFRPVDPSHTSPSDLAQLQALGGIVKHALQGRKTSDHHSHEDLEQIYYVLHGSAQVLIGEEKFPIREGDAIYLPAQTYHQVFNDQGEDWVETLVISCRLPQVRIGPKVICNWRDCVPAIQDKSTVRWTLLASSALPGAAEPVVCLQRMQGVIREAIQGQRSSGLRCAENLEQVYYLEQGEGTVVVAGTPHPIGEGHAIYIPPNVPHQIINGGREWLSYVVFQCRV